MSAAWATLIPATAGGRAAEGDRGASPVGAVLLLALGVVLTVVGVRDWRNRGDHSEPPVLAMVGRMGPPAVGTLALGATISNPKNLVILLGAAGVDVVLATLPYTGAAVYSVAGGVGARARLDELRGWLIVHNRAIIGVVAIVIGLALAAKGAVALL